MGCPVFSHAMAIVNDCMNAKLKNPLSSANHNNAHSQIPQQTHHAIAQHSKCHHRCRQAHCEGWAERKRPIKQRMGGAAPIRPVPMRYIHSALAAHAAHQKMPISHSKNVQRHNRQRIGVQRRQHRHRQIHLGKKNPQYRNQDLKRTRNQTAEQACGHATGYTAAIDRPQIGMCKMVFEGPEHSTVLKRVRLW